MEENVMDNLFSQINGRIAVISGCLGHIYKGEYLIEPDCLESVKDLIRLLKKDDKYHISRRCMGKTNIVKSHLIHIIKNCTDSNNLLSITLRLLINLTTPALLLYNEEIPQDKLERHVYITLLDYDQKYKTSFSDVEFWSKICTRLTNLFDIDWTERSADDEIEIERIFILLRNVLHIPSDIEDEKKPDNVLSDHDKVIEALRHSHLLELLLVISSNTNEESHYLNLLEIFSLLLREQNPKVLACSDINKFEEEEEKTKDLTDVIRYKEIQNNIRKSYSNCRYFNSSFVMKGVKSASNNDIVCHKSLENIKNLNICKNQNRPIKNKIAIETGNKERRSTFSFRLFLKEFCTEFLSSSFSNFMNVIKNRLDSGKSLAHDQTYYFWALSFFLKFAIETKANIDLIKNCLVLDTFHFIQTNIDAAFEYLQTDKKKVTNWVKRIHIILKAFNSLLETLLFMDNSKNPLIRAHSREIKSEIFYVVEYREMSLQLLLKYDSNKFPLSYLQDLVQTVHLFIKLLEEFSKQKKLVVQKVIKNRKSKKKDKLDNENQAEEDVLENQETNDEKWEKIKDSIYDMIVAETSFPEIPPFDATLDIPIDDQKKQAMQKIQKFLHEGKIEQSIGLLRSSREVWPENDYFGFDGITAEDEVVILREICLADLGPVNESTKKNENCNRDEKKVEKEKEKEEEEEEEEADFENEHKENAFKFIEQDFDLLSYKKRFAHKKVVESCGILLKYYKKNSDYINHCAIKLLHRISWECCMPAMLYQASLWWTLLSIMNDTFRQYNEINIFTVNLLRKFRKDAMKSKVVFLELLFWKDHNTAIEIQHGYNPYDIEASKKSSKKKKPKDETDNFNTDINNDNDINNENDINDCNEKSDKKKNVRKRIKNSKKAFKKVDEENENKTQKKRKEKNKKDSGDYDSNKKQEKKKKTKSKDGPKNEKREDLFFTNDEKGEEDLLLIKKNKEHNHTDLEDMSDSECQLSSHSFRKKMKSQVLPLSSEEEEEIVADGNLQNLTKKKKTFKNYDENTEISEKYDFQDIDFSKAKRRRIIDSDSDEELIVSRNQRGKKGVIDSESDADEFEV